MSGTGVLLLLVPRGGHHAGCQVATTERQLRSAPAARRALGSCLCSWGHKNSWDEFLAGSACLSSGRCWGSLCAAWGAWLGNVGCPPPAPSPAFGDVAASAAAGLYVPPPASGGANHNNLGWGGLLEAPGLSGHSAGLLGTGVLVRHWDLGYKGGCCRQPLSLPAGSPWVSPRQVPLEDHVIYSGNLFQYIEENKKWRNRFCVVPHNYGLVLYENKLVSTPRLRHHLLAGGQPAQGAQSLLMSPLCSRPALPGDNARG